MRNSWENLGNSSREIPRNWSQEIPWIELREFPRNGLQEIPRTWFLGIGYEKFLGIAVDIFTGFSCERFLGISTDSQERFLGISADFPQIVTWVRTTMCAKENGDHFENQMKKSKYFLLFAKRLNEKTVDNLINVIHNDLTCSCTRIINYIV